jgi:hypothetical protein
MQSTAFGVSILITLNSDADVTIAVLASVFYAMQRIYQIFFLILATALIWTSADP